MPTSCCTSTAADDFAAAVAMCMQWGESLRQGADEAWAPYLASTYQVANLQVAKPVRCGLRCLVFQLSTALQLLNSQIVSCYC
jgi:hypothetical protein